MVNNSLPADPGVIDKNEFVKGIEMLNDFMSNKPIQSDNYVHEPLDASTLFTLVDQNGDGRVQLNEFCECFRLSTQR
jgi:Ca2+-binding EF-hand superfamily protein